MEMNVRKQNADSVPSPFNKGSIRVGPFRMKVLLRPLLLFVYVMVCISMNCSSVAQENKDPWERPPGTPPSEHLEPAQSRKSDAIPEIKCALRYPMKIEKGVVQRRGHPEATVVNVGPVKVGALAVDLTLYTYETRTAKIATYIEMHNGSHGHFMFKEGLKSADEASEQVVGTQNQGFISVYVFSLTYYREGDMKKFNRSERFFEQDFNIVPESDYSRKTNYRKILKAIKSFKPRTADNQFSMYGADGGWVLGNGKVGLFMFKDCGLFTQSIPRDLRAVIKEQYANENRPLLYIKPVILEETGAYWSPKVVDRDTVCVTFKYEVENVGKSAAVRISIAGGDTYPKHLVPGGKIYRNEPVVGIVEKDSKQTAQDLIRNMDKESFTLEVTFSFLYYQDAGNREYMTRFTYRIRKDKAELIAYEIK